MKRVGFSAVSALLLLTISQSALAEWGLNMTEGVTRVSHEVHDLHMTIFYICVAIAVVVFGVMLYSIIYHRKSRGAKAENFHESTVVEIIWTIIPLVILVGMCIPATATLIDMYDNTDSEIDIQVTGYQWKWRYTYLNEGVDFFSNLSTPSEQLELDNTQEKNINYLLEVDKPLVLPVDTKVRFLFTSKDVIHSWWVPDLAVKKDTIPGFINESWAIIDKPGIYRGQCTELCGKGHGYMPIVVKAVSKQEYKTWVTAQAVAQAAAKEIKDMSFDELMTQGEKVYNTNCAACHKKNGTGIPPMFPALKDSPIAMGDISDHIKIVLKGKQGTAMSAFAEQLSVSDIASVVTYERNAWGNNKGDHATPMSVKKIKDNK